MISETSYKEFKEHIESLRQIAWKMFMEESDNLNLDAAELWRGKQFAYETVLNELVRRERLDKNAVPR